MAIFADRADAGQRLAPLLEEWRGTDAVVLGIPRGGVVVAAVVAEALDLPLDVAVVRKLGAPSHEEYAVGAIADGVRIVHPEAMRSGDISPDQLAAVEARERAELQRRQQLFGAASVPLEGRTVIVVDDGIATGATLVAACQAVRARKAAHVVAAVPVAPERWLPDESIDTYICPHRERDFWAVGQFYEDFTQTSDEQVARLLARHRSSGDDA